MTRQPPQTLWYAHFHYPSAKSPFNDFVKGHLKLPEQRNLGLQWQQAQASSGAQVESIWRGDIGKPLAHKHFSTAVKNNNGAPESAPLSVSCQAS
ncbi:hypothetical protein ACFS4T_28085 [Pseudomonas lini]